tara:strand:+ start:249 stop:920 length:672 start_codon:yes stop_codon:yes gene_type:complete
MKKKYKVTFLLDKKNQWFEKYLENYNFNLKKYNFIITKNPQIIKNQDIVFPLNYTKTLSTNFLKKNKLTLIVHSSKLPKNKGFAPAQYQILKNKKKIYISLIKAVKKIDSGPIYLQDFFLLNDTELYDEIRHKQGSVMIKIIKKFLTKYPKIKMTNQIGKASYNKRRYPKNSELNINKSIKSQFNHMRINNNELWPSFFKYKNCEYVLKIYKKKGTLLNKLFK